MWRSTSLRTRLNLIFASLFALWLIVDAGHAVFEASARVRAETESAMRLTKEFVSTSLGRLRGPPEPEAVEALIASLQNLRHVRAGLGEPLLALSIIGAENSQLECAAMVSRAYPYANRGCRDPGSFERWQVRVDCHRSRSG